MGAARTSASAADRRAWGRLVAECAAQAERPRRDARELARAARACATAVVPAGPWDRTNALFRLLEMARHVAALDPAGRTTQAAALRGAVAAGRALWPEAEGEAPPPAPPRPLGGPCSAATRPAVRYPSPAAYPPPPGSPEGRERRVRADIDG